jgi:hypothetical protein
MPSMNLRQLRDTRQLKQWLAEGKVVELRERNRVLGRIMPEHTSKRREPAEWPDFAARRKRIFGDRVVPIVEDLIAERNSRF